jgi:hypothetical protein
MSRRARSRQIVSPSETPIDDPAITEVEVMYGQVVHRGSRVKHFGQRYTCWATATVVGFYYHEGRIKVLLKHDDPDEPYNFTGGWDADRTELTPDPPHN